LLEALATRTNETPHLRLTTVMASKSSGNKGVAAVQHQSLVHVYPYNPQFYKHCPNTKTTIMITSCSTCTTLSFTASQQDSPLNKLQFVAFKLLNQISNWFSSYCYFDITEIDGVNTNELYNAVQLYLSSFVSIISSHLSLTHALNSSTVTFGLSNNDCIANTYNTVTVI
jgi:hypothetical protein